MPSSSPAPLEAVVLPDLPPQRSNRWRWLKAVGALVLTVACVSAAIWGVGKLATGPRTAEGDPRSLIDTWETPAQRLGSISAAMNAAEVGCSTGELRDFQRLFTRLANASRDGDPVAFQNCLDLNLLVRRISRHPAVRGDRSFSSWSLKSELQSLLQPPTDFGEVAIVRVERGRHPDQALVYTVSTNYTQTAAFRWWLSRSGRNWRAFDYERLDHGHSLAAGWALREAIARDPNGYNYRQLQTAIQQRQAPFGGYGRMTNRDGGQQLEVLLDQPLPDIVHDIGRIDLAWALVGNNRPAAALKACAAVRQPDEHPGVYLVRARALALLQRHANAAAECEQYRRIAGRDPQALAIEAQAAEALEDYSAAAEKWREQLQLCPQNSQALANFCRLATAQQRVELPEILGRMSKPVEVAIQQAQTALYRDDLATFDVLAQFVARQSPHSSEEEALEAAKLAQEESYEQAAELYLKAAQAQWLPEKKQEYFYQYLSAMTQAGKAAEGYSRADDPQAAFEYLTSGFEEEESVVPKEQLPALLAAHRQRVPGDAMTDYYEGLLLLADGKYAEAEARFAAAQEQGGEDYEREMFQSRRIEALYRLGRGDDAYANFGRNSEVFQQLAQLHQQEGEWDALRRLIAIHRGYQADDPWYEYYSALELQERGLYQQALAAIRKAENGDESMRLSCQWIKTELAIQSGDLRAAYQEGADRRETFARLAARLASQEDWQHVGQLVALHAEYLPVDPAAQEWNTRALLAQGKYEELIADLSPWPKFTHDPAPGTLETLYERLVRSLLRLGRKDEARAAAERAASELEHQAPLVMVLLAEGNFAELQKVLADRPLVRTLLARELDDDPELRQLLHTAELAAWRKTIHLPLPHRWTNQGLVLLLAQPLAISAADLEAHLAAIGVAGAEVRPVSRAAYEAQSSYRIGTQHGTLVLTLSEQPYGRSGDRQPPPRDAALARIINEHAAHVAIDFFPVELEPGSSELQRTACRLAARIGDGKAQAVSGSLTAGEEHRLAALTPRVLATLRAGNFLGQEANQPDGIRYTLLPQEIFEDDASPGPWKARRRAVRQLAAKIQAGGAGPHEVTVNVACGHARERLALEITSLKPDGYGTWRLEGELRKPSALWPHLVAGTHVQVDASEVLEVSR